MMITITWTCPNCGHIVRDAREDAREFVGYCDDQADDGCGEGPFYVEPSVSAIVSRIEGKDYGPTMYRVTALWCDHEHEEGLGSMSELDFDEMLERNTQDDQFFMYELHEPDHNAPPVKSGRGLKEC